MTSRATMRETLRSRGIGPGTLSLAEAAAYVGLSPNTFLTEVAAGKMPAPIDLKSRRKLWPKAALDRRLGATQTDETALQAAIAEAIETYGA